MTEDFTLAEFPPVSTAEWEAAIRQDLKGKAPARKLFYRADDVPGEFPYACDSHGWEIREIVRAGERGLPLRQGVHYEAGERAAEIVEALLARPDVQPASVDYEPLADFDRAAELVVRSQAVPGFRPITIAAQELGGALAEGVEILAQLGARGVAPAEAAGALIFSFGIGSSYFAEIARLRAARALWARVVESFGAPAATMMILARTSHWTKTIYDSHVNLLRATTEAMAAVIGGAGVLAVEPFDATYREPGEFSRRLARNTQLILKHEALLDRAADPARGCYYLEALTDSVARDAWKLLQEIEAAGGYLHYKPSPPQAPPRTIVGVNRYPNLAERMLAEIQFEDPVPRAAGEFEQVRLRTERYAARTGHTPRFLLLESGDRKMRQARSAFATNFFGAADFEIQTADALTGEPDAVVLCSSDAEYAELAPRILRQLRAAGKSTPVIVAGNPGVIDGVADYIHLRSDHLAVLRAWQQRLGVTA